TNFFSKISVAEILLEAQNLEVGDEILITGETTGAYEDTVKEIRVDLKSVQEAIKGNFFSIKTTDLVRRNDKVYKIVEAKKIKNR
ncbi:MAG: collagenase-like protease, partial [Paludibacter sp.]